MGGDVASLAAETTPYVSAPVGAEDGTILAKSRDDAADAAVDLGQRLLRKVFGHRVEEAPLPRPLADFAADADALAAVQLAVSKALATDNVLASEVRSILVSTPGVSEQVWAARGAYTAGRDQIVVHYREPSDD